MGEWDFPNLVRRGEMRAEPITDVRQLTPLFLDQRAPKKMCEFEAAELLLFGGCVKEWPFPREGQDPGIRKSRSQFEL